MAGETLGLLAGRGALPRELAAAARRRGLRVAAVAFRGLADAALETEVDSLVRLHPGEVDAVVSSLLSAGVRDAVVAGHVPKTALLAGGSRPVLDAGGRALLSRLRDRRDHSILQAVADTLASHGIRLLPQAELVPELVAEEGPLTRAAPGPEQLADIAFAWPIAKAVAALDVGQTLVVKDRAVLAVEAIEGTNAAIRRAGAIAAGACVVKVARTGQDLRFDLPAIGLETLAALRDAGAAALACEAGRTVVLGRAELVRAADACGVALLGVAPEGLPGAPA